MKNKSLNSIEKAISYPVRKPKALPPKTKRIIKLSKGGKPEEQKPKPKPQSNVIQFPIKPGMPLYEWWKTNKDKTMYVASAEELGPFLTKFYSEKQILDMDDNQIETILQDLLEKGLL